MVRTDFEDYIALSVDFDNRSCWLAEVIFRMQWISNLGSSLLKICMSCCLEWEASSIVDIDIVASA